jgi:hypothetical protein
MVACVEENIAGKVNHLDVFIMDLCIFVFRRGTTDVGEAVVRQLLLGVFCFVVAWRADALVVVHEVLTRAWLACVDWAIRNILANAHACGVEIFLEAAVANALVVILVNTSRSRRIDALSLATLVALAIVNVCAPIMGGQLACAQASCGH